MSLAQQPFNVARKIADIAREHPDQPAIIAADITLPYKNYWRIVRGFAVRMAERGIGPGSIVGALTRDMIASLALQHAAALLGAGYVVIEPELPVGGSVHPTHVFRTPESQEVPGYRFELVDGTWPQAAADDPGADGSEFVGYRAEDDDWYYVHTSGTTGRPKYLALSQKDVFLRSEAAADVDYPYLDTRLCCLFPANTRPFFARANAVMFNAGTLIDTIDVDMLQRTGTSVVCASPLTASDWLKNRVISPRLPLIQVSGSKLTSEVALHLLKSFERVEDVYGASETSKSYATDHHLEAGNLVRAGKPLDSILEIVDEDGSPIQEVGRSGRLRVRNPYMASAYIDAPDASAAAFRDGWFYPGDLASWGPARELQLQGRGDNLLNLGGAKINPEEIEAVLMASQGISRAAAMILPVEMTPPVVLALVTLSPGATPDNSVPAARDACEVALPNPAVPRLILVVRDIPVTGDNTPKRRECEMIAEKSIAGLNLKELIGHD